MRSVSVRAPAKVNLCLEILRRRPDGYHDLATVFQAVSLADELRVTVRERPGIELSVPGGGAPEGPGNLAWQAADSYAQARGWPPGVSIELRKHIPAGAGLGGGSSDAAATLRALAALDAEPPEMEALTALAVEIGSDVAFLIRGGTAIGRGRGEELEALPPLKGCAIVLARPELSISTADAYGMLEECDFTDGAHAREMAAALRAGGSVGAVATHVFNGFTRVLVERWPVLGELTARLGKTGALAAEITGSGSAVLGLFDDERAAGMAADELERDGLWSEVARPVTALPEIRERTE